MLFRKKDAALSRNYSEQIEKLKQEIKIADAIVIGAGAGLSASAGLVYTGERLEKYFGDFSYARGVASDIDNQKIDTIKSLIEGNIK